MKDVVIGSFLGYKPNHLAPWINSLRRSGYSGAVAVFAYGDGANERDSARYLRHQGAEVHFRPAIRKSIVVNRFADMADYLENSGGRYRHAICTDMGDVVFQSNPSRYLDRHWREGKSILVGSECIRYRDQSWNRENLLHSFPQHASTLLSQTVYNAGVIAVRAPVAGSFFREIHRLSLSSPCANPDQAALNLLVHGDFRDQSQLAQMKDGWAVHCALCATPEGLQECSAKLLEPPPHFVGISARLPDQTPACILHQYTRIPVLGERIRRYFGGSEKESLAFRLQRKWWRMFERLPAESTWPHMSPSAPPQNQGNGTCHAEIQPK